MKRMLYLLTLLIFVVAILLSIVKVMAQNTQRSNLDAHSNTHIVGGYRTDTPALAAPALAALAGADGVQNNTHIVGGFSPDTPARATRAGADGVHIAFNYGQPPSESSILGYKLQSLHMQV